MIDDTIVIERSDDKKRFYEDRIDVADMLADKAGHVSYTKKDLDEND